MNGANSSIAAGNGNGGNAQQTQVAEDPIANYSLQGVMQWLNCEYRRYERERNAWEIERSNYVVIDIYPDESDLCWLKYRI